MQRLYQTIVLDHLQKFDQMIFLCGPRQVGKTTIVQNLEKSYPNRLYLNWDNIDNRNLILSGQKNIINLLNLEHLQLSKPLLIFDEIHKYKHWKTFLKGLIDEYKGKINIIVTGSAKLNTFRKGGDSLMGRYFLYRTHPLTVAEILTTDISNGLLRKPQHIDEHAWDNLFNFGGYPEPYLRHDQQFYRRWQNLREEQLFKEDILSLSQVQNLAQMEVLGVHIKQQATKLVNYSNFANKIRVADQTIRRWINVMENFYYCFTLRPWHINVSRSLLKEPKIYLWDWSQVGDEGAKIENFVACHLLKAVHFWNDIGMGKFSLHFVRDKEKNEVDFLIAKNNDPWMLLEVKKSGHESISKSLYLFHRQLKTQYAFQLAYDLDYVEYDCNTLQDIKIIPLKTFLSQLV